MQEIGVLFVLSSWTYIVYVYLGYPLILWILVQLRFRSVLQNDITPFVTLIISAYNEELSIQGKLENSLALDYPRDSLEIIVVSDASTDKTDSLVQAFETRGAILLRRSERGGKTLGLNAALKSAKGDVVLFSDANIFYDKGVVRRLVRNFADPLVGCVTGDSRYITDTITAAHRQESAYWDYERLIRTWESQIGSSVGGDGAIFAIRREFFTELAPDAINDLVIPLQIVSAGFRAVFEPGAVGYESSAGTYGGEFRRKQRIVNRSWKGILSVSGILNPLKVGIFAWQVWSHKLLRWFVLPVWVASGFVCILGAGINFVFVVGALGFLASLVIGGLGVFTLKKSWLVARMAQATAYFYLVNLAAFIGILRAIFGKVEILWDSERQKSENR